MKRVCEERDNYGDGCGRVGTDGHETWAGRQAIRKTRRNVRGARGGCARKRPRGVRGGKAVDCRREDGEEGRTRRATRRQQSSRRDMRRVGKDGKDQGEKRKRKTEDGGERVRGRAESKSEDGWVATSLS